MDTLWIVVFGLGVLVWLRRVVTTKLVVVYCGMKVICVLGRRCFMLLNGDACSL